MKRKVKYLTLVVGVGFIGVAAWQAGGPDEAWQAGGRESATPPKSRATAIQLSDGSWCADSPIPACVHPSGQVIIPGGKAGETLWAYHQIRPHIPGAEQLGVFGYEVLPVASVHTNEVTGALGPNETLNRMLEGTGLEARYFSSGIAVRPRK